MSSPSVVNFLQDLARFATRPISSILRQWQQQGGIQGSKVDQVGSMDATNRCVARKPLVVIGIAWMISHRRVKTNKDMPGRFGLKSCGAKRSLRIGAAWTGHSKMWELGGIWM